MLELKDRIEEYVPLDEIEKALRYLYLNHIPYDRFDSESGYFIREFRGSSRMSQEEANERFRVFLAASLDNRYLDTSFYIPKGRNLYIWKYPRYMPDVMHYHKDAMEIDMVLKGEFDLEVQGAVLKLVPGDVCFISPQTRHKARAFDDNTVVLTIMIYESLIKKRLQIADPEEDILLIFLRKNLYGNSYHPYLLCRTGFDPDMAGMLMDLEACQSEPSPHVPAYLETGVELFILRILLKHEDKVILGNNVEKNHSDILNIMDYVEANYTSITLNGLAQVYNYSPCYLSSLIKSQYGKSFHEIITGIKLDRAARLLRETGESMTRIAEMVGYSDKSYFLKRFKKQYGVTPTEYRAANQIYEVER